MSYILNADHVRLLVQVAGEQVHGTTWHSWREGATGHRCHNSHPESLRTTFAMLYLTLVKSVATRYPGEDELPGPLVDGKGLHPDTPPPEYRRVARPFLGNDHPAVVLKALRCYAHQSCCYPGWWKCDAKAFCDALTARLIEHLPEWDSAPWEWSETSYGGRLYRPAGATD